MDYKKKLKQRLYIGMICIALGIMMIVGVFASESNNEFISAFGFAIVMVGVARIIQYLRITKDEERIEKQKINETDERNLSIIQKARSAAFSIYLFITCTAIIITSLFDMHEVANLLGYSQLVLIVIYWICYWIYQKEL
ncbi:MAG: hypothetical protein IJC88_00315 [Oscillospiraceae bacterium]|nr:hypothetical protein [Oscillospiraceae bacterium]